MSKKLNKHIYIAGQVSGLPADEVEALFEKAVTELKVIGCDVFNPVFYVKEIGYTDQPYTKIMKLCIKNLIECDGILMLHNWQRSKGANIERNIAIALEIPVFYSLDEINF